MRRPQARLQLREGTSAECGPDALPTLAAGTLTIATSEPAFEPWMVDNDPANGKGYESAVAYAVAEQLGFGKDQVTWTRVGFDEAHDNRSGLDFDINQFTITDDRKKVVDFSSGYYTVTQTVITIDGSPIERGDDAGRSQGRPARRDERHDQPAAITDMIEPAKTPRCSTTTRLAAQALQNGQIDGLVVDLPTAFYMTGAQLDDGKVIGQLQAPSGQAEQLGLLLAKDSPLTACVSQRRRRAPCRRHPGRVRRDLAGRGRHRSGARADPG